MAKSPNPAPAGVHEAAQALAVLMTRHHGAPVAIERLVPLTGGASRQTLAFEAVLPDRRRQRLILRRDPVAKSGQPSDTDSDSLRLGPSWASEFALLRCAEQQGVPVPPALIELTPQDGLGQGFIVGFVEGETLARRILREPVFANARSLLARQCGEIAGRIHGAQRAGLPPLPALTTIDHIALYRRRLAQWDEPMPVFELALRWLGQNCPIEPGPADHGSGMTLVHGDFRLGNFIVGPEGMRAVLDWELAHIGDPYEDLGWICTKAWRFGAREPVGGFGARADLFAGYEAVTGRMVDRGRVRFWEIFGSLRWGIMCLMMAARHISGRQRSVELAAIGRRVSENEHDLLQLLQEKG